MRGQDIRFQRLVGSVLLLAGVGAILLATLTPGSGPDPEPWQGCLLCGTRGTAAAIVNVILFLPLGAGLALRGWSWPRATAAAFGLSLTVELVQMQIPGRDPSFGDLLFNTLGGALGALLVVLASLWLRPAPRRAAWLSLAAAAVAAGVIGATGLLLQPSYPASTYYGQWTPRLGHLEWYDGEVLEAFVGDIEIGWRRLPNSAQVREALLADAPLRVRAVGGTPPAGLASLVSIYDGEQREIVLLGPDRNDLVYRYHTRARALLLDQPDVRAAGLTRGTAAGDTVVSASVRRADGYCLRWGEREACGLGFTAGQGWALLYYQEGFPGWFQRALGAAWLAALALPFGLWARRRWASLAGAAVLVGAVLVLPGLVGLLAMPASQVAGAAGGLTLGAGVARLATHRPRCS